MVVFGLEFSDNVDPTALATVALALLTFVTVVAGGLALRRTRTEIDLSRSEVEQAHRPVLIPVLDEHQGTDLHDAITTYQVKPIALERDRLVLPIKNIGSGPALDITVSVLPVTPSGTVFSWGTVDATLVGLAVSEMFPVTLRIPGLTQLTSVPSFELTVRYLDGAGKPWLPLLAPQQQWALAGREQASAAPSVASRSSHSAFDQAQTDRALGTGSARRRAHASVCL
jgi:hypothetical protein